jgi:hypothetical protein
VVRARCDAQLEDEPALQRGGISEHGDDAGKEAVEDEELALARELGARLDGRAQALLERLLEGLGRGVGAWGHLRGLRTARGRSRLRQALRA